MRPIVKLLGYAGLLPFVVLAILSVLFSQNSLLLDALSLYSFGIFAFLCGAWWPTQDMQHANFWRIVLSNIFFLVAFFTFLFFTELWLAVGAGLFMILWLFEHYSALLPKSPPDYRKLRLILSIVASSSMLTPYLFGVLKIGQS